MKKWNEKNGGMHKLTDRKERVKGLGAEVVGSSPAEITAYVEGEIDRGSKVDKAAGVKLD